MKRQKKKNTIKGEYSRAKSRFISMVISASLDGVWQYIDSFCSFDGENKKE